MGDARMRSTQWGKQGPRVMCKEFNDNKIWFFTTWGAIVHLCSFEEPDALINEEEVAFGPPQQSNEKGDVFCCAPPYLHFLGCTKSFSFRGLD